MSRRDKLIETESRFLECLGRRQWGVTADGCGVSSGRGLGQFLVAGGLRLQWRASGMLWAGSSIVVSTGSGEHRGCGSPVCAAGAGEAGGLPSAAAPPEPPPPPRGDQRTPEGAVQRAAALCGGPAVEGHVPGRPVEVGR